MKRIAITLAVLLSGMSSIVAVAADYRLSVKGMACEFCAKRLEKTLLNLRGVQAAQIHPSSGRVDVDMSGSHQLAENDVRQVVEAGGFSLEDMQQVQAATNR